MVELGGFVQSDIDAFTSCYRIEDPVTPTVVLTGTLPAPLGVDSETTLDIEVTLAVAPQLDALYVFEAAGRTFADVVLLYAATLDRSKTAGETFRWCRRASAPASRASRRAT